MKPLATALTVVALCGHAFAADKPTPEQIKFFESKIRPVLADNCYQCHSADAKKLKANLKLDTRAALRAGGDTGPAIVPGKPEKSLLIKALKYQDENCQMPPKGKLADEVIADFERWVMAGAPDPRDGTSAVDRGEIDIEKGKQHWAFQPVKATPAPATKASDWPATDVDRYLLAAMEAKGLAPVADADERTLLRRVYLDLTGLPPTPGDVDKFVAAAAKDRQIALETIVDKLLASPQFGERWGRHWLDVARYAESTGKSVNFNYPHAWRYRDYVIDAFNKDKPFDQFVREQLAGDLMPHANSREKAEHLTATGFLALGTKSLNERNPVQFDLDVADEQIDAFSQAFLGITAACARCHDHKFDPIPQKDYYSLAGIFRSTQTLYGTINSIQARHPSELVHLPKDAGLPPGQPSLSKREREQLETQLKRFRGELDDMTKSRGARETFVSANGVRNRIQIQTLEARLDLYEADGSPKLLAMGARDKFRPRNSPVYQRGEVDKPSAEVQRGVLQAVGPAVNIERGSGRRELADWVASPDNPLTARVYVNRVWRHLFGRGLVTTPDNFGVNGEAPANAVLLDHLAKWFMDHGWSTKQLVKYVMLSHAYRLSTRPDAKALEADPENTLCWRMTPARLDAETIRDSMLAVSGQLDLKPPYGSVVARVGDGYSAAMNRPGPRGRGAPPEPTIRSVYLPIIRDSLPESLSLFDAADPNLVTGNRANTTVPAQALFLMNNPFVIKQAEGVWEALLKVNGEEARVREAYRRIYGRDPSARELADASEFIAHYGQSKKPRETWTAFCQALLGSAEFLMRN